MVIIHSNTASNARSEFEPWFRLRNAIFRQAFADWENDEICRPKHRKYVLEIFSKLPPVEQQQQYSIARALNLRWAYAAEIWMWFHSPDADALLIDCGFTGADLWRMYLDGSWNRGEIKDKPYEKATLPTDSEMRRRLPGRFSDLTDISFAGRAFPERHARDRAKEYEKRMKEGGNKK